MVWTRFAIYYLPPPGPLAEFGARWLGWDVTRGISARQPDLPGLAEITRRPRKYGFHGTLKPPFRLAPGTDLAGLKAAVAHMASGLAPAETHGLTLSRIGSFLALTPTGETRDLARVAATCVSALDAFRDPPTQAELDRRRRARLSPRQEALLQQWGYPHVMDEFRFHLTLTGRLSQPDDWETTLRKHLPPLPQPFTLSEVTLCGERDDGHFVEIKRFALTG